MLLLTLWRKQLGTEVLPNLTKEVPVETVFMQDDNSSALRFLPNVLNRLWTCSHAISLNDSFRFTRELFAGDATRMNEVVRLAVGFFIG